MFIVIAQPYRDYNRSLTQADIAGASVGYHLALCELAYFDLNLSGITVWNRRTWAEA